MVHISSPSIIYTFTLIIFSQLLIFFIVYPYILMESLKDLYILLHMIIFMIYHSLVSSYHIREVLHQVGRMICDPHHNFAVVQGIYCINFCTLWKGVCTYIFSILDYVYRSEFDSKNKHSDNAPTSSVDEIQGVSQLPSCKFYTPAHDHGVHDLFSKSFIQKQFSQIIKVKMNIC